MWGPVQWWKILTYSWRSEVVWRLKSDFPGQRCCQSAKNRPFFLAELWVDTFNTFQVKIQVRIWLKQFSLIQKTLKTVELLNLFITPLFTSSAKLSCSLSSAVLSHHHQLTPSQQNAGRSFVLSNQKKEEGFESSFCQPSQSEKRKRVSELLSAWI
jgi:hypothetical protein